MFFFFFLVLVSFYSRGLQLLKGATQCSLLSLKKRMKPGTEWERPADKAAKHYGNGVAEFLRCTHTHTCSHTHKQDKTQTLKSAPGHIIMRWCIWLAAAQNNGPDPRHLCGGLHQREPADHQRVDHNASGVLECPPLAVAGQKKGQVHQQAAPDWLSRTQKAAGGKEPFSLAAAASFCWWMGVWEDGTGTTGSTGRVWGKPCKLFANIFVHMQRASQCNSSFNVSSLKQHKSRRTPTIDHLLSFYINQPTKEEFKRPLYVVSQGNRCWWTAIPLCNSE